MLCLLPFFTIAQVQVPQNIRQTFKENHISHDYVTWTMEGQNYKASSVDEAKRQHITVYSPAGTIVRTEREIASKEIPSAIVGYFNEKYPGEMNYSVWLVEDSNGNRSYFSTHNNVNVLFDSEGRINSNVQGARDKK